jgi:hypothetical protein
MKFVRLIILGACLCFTVTAMSRNFTGSTPANAVVKSFLGIPLTDSIDFVRWTLDIDPQQFHLSCNYGIGNRVRMALLMVENKLNSAAQ